MTLPPPTPLTDEALANAMPLTNAELERAALMPTAYTLRNDDVLATITSLTSDLQRTREALRPFADLLPAIEGHMGTPQTGELMIWERRTGSYALTVEHLKSARAALASTPATP
jgi:hypothetical protein